MTWPWAHKAHTGPEGHARAHRVFQAAALGAGTRATRVAEAASAKSVAKEEHTLAQDKVEIVLALEREEKRSTAVLHLTNPSRRDCPCECTSVAKTIQLRLHSRSRGQRVANGYERDQCLVPDTVLGGTGGRQSGGAAFEGPRPGVRIWALPPISAHPALECKVAQSCLAASF